MGELVWCEGPLGAGKSTFTRGCAEFLGMRPLFEPVEENFLLPKFYEDPRGYAFPLQMHLLMVRFNMQMLAASEAVFGRGAILDRGLPGDRVFCKMHIRYGNIAEELWPVYENAYNIMSSLLRPPGVLIYLDVSPEVALRRAHSRGRDVESKLELEYLQNLCAGYDELMAEIEGGGHFWSRGIRILRVPWDRDFIDPRPVYEEIGRMIGLKPVTATIDLPYAPVAEVDFRVQAS